MIIGVQVGSKLVVVVRSDRPRSTSLIPNQLVPMVGMVAIFRKDLSIHCIMVKGQIFCPPIYHYHDPHRAGLPPTWQSSASH